MLHCFYLTIYQGLMNHLIVLVKKQPENFFNKVGEIEFLLYNARLYFDGLK